MYNSTKFQPRIFVGLAPIGMFDINIEIPSAMFICALRKVGVDWPCGAFAKKTNGLVKTDIKSRREVNGNSLN